MARGRFHPPQSTHFQAARGDSEGQEEEKERESAFIPDRNPIEFPLVAHLATETQPWQSVESLR
jgi:hypothetical protein